MLCPEKPDAFRAKSQCLCSILRCVRIGTHPDGLGFIHQLHQVLIALVVVQFDIHERKLAIVYQSLGAIQAHPVAFVNHLTSNGLKCFCFGMDLDVPATHDATLTPSACNQCRVRSHASFGG